MLKVLITDDQEHVLDALELLFEMRGGFDVVRSKSPDEAIAAVERGGIGVVVHDMNFSQGTTGGEEGAALFCRIRQIDPEMPVILMTAWASLETAVALVKQGADDYLQKPWDDQVLLKKVGNLLRARESAGVRGPVASERLSSTPAPTMLDARADLCGLLFESAAMHSLVSLAVKIAPSDVPVLITGPNGSGKEKLAEIVQANSLRRQGPFVRVNVGALPDELFAAELFGAEAGAFTGARARRTGRFEAANGGTLFLDEMGNLSLESQAKLLRALQSGEFERLGSNQTHLADVRVIAATNVDMPRAIGEGRFREDLYYRLAVIELEVPPLASRPEDVLALARAFAQGYRGISGHRSPPAAARFSAACVQALRSHDWPGNVRELQNRVRRALLMAEGGELEPTHLGLESPGTRSTQSPPARVGTVGDAHALSGERESVPSLDQAEREAIERALAESDYVVSRAASALKVSRQALYRRMQRLGIRLKREVE